MFGRMALWLGGRGFGVERDEQASGKNMDKKSWWNLPQPRWDSAFRQEAFVLGNRLYRLEPQLVGEYEGGKDNRKTAELTRGSESPENNK